MPLRLAGMGRTGYRRWRSSGVELTERQRQVLRLIERGYSNGEIAEALGISLDGAKFHVSEILSKLGVTSREEAAAAWKSSRETSSTSALVAMLKWAAAASGAAALGAGAVLIWAASRDGGDDVPGSPGLSPSPVVLASATPFQCPPPRTPTPTLGPGLTPTPEPVADGPFSVRFFGRWYSQNNVMGAVIPAERVPSTLLGPQVGEICFASVRGNRPAAGDIARDGDSFGLSEGMLVYSVVGYAPTFRLALAVPDQEPIMLEVREFEGAKSGADLLDFRDKAMGLSVYAPALNEPGVIADPPPLVGRVLDETALMRLIDSIMSAPVVPLVIPPQNSDWYTLEFLMEDGTHVSREFNASTGLVWPGIDVPASFEAEIARIIAAPP